MKFRHVKRGTEYEIVDIYHVEGDPIYDGEELHMEFEGENITTIVQTAQPFSEGMLVQYFDLYSGQDYVRPALEFFDGRFERI